MPHHLRCERLGNFFLKTELDEPWLELLRSFFSNGRSGMVDHPVNYLHIDAKKDRIHHLFLHKHPSGVSPNSLSSRVNSSAASLSQPQSFEISVNRAKVFLRHAKVGPNKTKVRIFRSIYFANISGFGMPVTPKTPWGLTHE